MSNTPKTDALFFPYGRDHTAAAEPSLLVCMTQYELLERENAALREQLAAHLDWPKEPSDEIIRAGLRIMASDGALSAVSDIYEAMRLAHIKEEGK